MSAGRLFPDANCDHAERTARLDREPHQRDELEASPTWLTAPAKYARRKSGSARSALGRAGSFSTAE
jgi:hypothetical protein